MGSRISELPSDWYLSDRKELHCGQQWTPIPFSQFPSLIGCLLPCWWFLFAFLLNHLKVQFLPHYLIRIVSYLCHLWPPSVFFSHCPLSLCWRCVAFRWEGSSGKGQRWGAWQARVVGLVIPLLSNFAMLLLWVSSITQMSALKMIKPDAITEGINLGPSWKQLATH